MSIELGIVQVRGKKIETCQSVQRPKLETQMDMSISERMYFQQHWELMKDILFPVDPEVEEFYRTAASVVAESKSTKCIRDAVYNSLRVDIDQQLYEMGGSQPNAEQYAAFQRDLSLSDGYDLSDFIIIFTLALAEKMLTECAAAA
jgi:hypothetical protein